MKTAKYLFLLLLLWTTIAHADQTLVLPPGANTATFSITNLAGTAPITFQWQKNGVNITGATASSFTLTKPSAADTGTYTCVLTNPAGSSSTDKGIFTVAVLPSGQISITSS